MPEVSDEEVYSLARLDSCSNSRCCFSSRKNKHCSSEPNSIDNHNHLMVIMIINAIWLTHPSGCLHGLGTSGVVDYSLVLIFSVTFFSLVHTNTINLLPVCIIMLYVLRSR